MFKIELIPPLTNSETGSSASAVRPPAVDRATRSARDAGPTATTSAGSSAASSYTEKGERTRAQILDAALSLLLERGYDGATMRAIAERAGVSVGNAYYYYRSKEHLIQAFYGRTHREHVAACGDLLATPADFESRLRGVMRAKLDTIQPYHRFSGVLFKTAADPRSPLHPFSDESRPVRDESTRVFAEVVGGATDSLPEEVRTVLPELLWTYHMGVILFWIHDDSPGCQRSYLLMERTVSLVATLVRAARSPWMRPVTRRVLALLDDLGLGPSPGREF